MSDVESVELEEEWLEQNQAPPGLGGTMRDGARRLDRVMDEVSEGTQADMLLGLVMGFVFGIIMLFWIWERGIPRRQKLGILCGIACNLTVLAHPPPRPPSSHNLCCHEYQVFSTRSLPRISPPPPQPHKYKAVRPTPLWCTVEMLLTIGV